MRHSPTYAQIIKLALIATELQSVGIATYLHPAHLSEPTLDYPHDDTASQCTMWAALFEMREDEPQQCGALLYLSDNCRIVYSLSPDASGEVREAVERAWEGARSNELFVMLQTPPAA